jgi:methyl-accepting chemotaxis protein
VTGEQVEETGDQIEETGEQIEVAGEQADETGKQLQRMGRHGHDAAQNIGQINAVAHRAGLALSDVAKYAKELNQQIAEATSEIEGRMSLKAYFRRLHDVEFQAGETARALMYLDGRMERLNANSSDAARGVADLEMRLLELTASEDEVARARAERDKNELKIQIEKNRLEAERARVLGNDDEAQRLESENALLQKQIDLLSQIHHEEAKQRDRERVQERGDQGDTPTTSRTTPEPQTIKVVEHRFDDKRVRVVEDDSDDLLDLLDRQRQSSY